MARKRRRLVDYLVLDVELTFSVLAVRCVTPSAASVDESSLPLC